MKFQSNNNIMSTTDVDKLKEEYEALVDQVSALQVDFNALNSIIDGYDQSIETGTLSASNVNVSGEIDAPVINSSYKGTFNEIDYSTLFRGEPSVVQLYSINTNEYALFRTKEPANPCFEAVIQLDNPDKPFMIKDYHNVLMLIGAPEGYKLKRAPYNGYNYYFLVTASAVATNTVRAWVNGAIAEATTDMTAYGSSTTSVEATSIDQVAISGSVNVSNTSLSFENATISTLNSTSATIATLTSTNFNAATANITTGNIDTANTKNITNTNAITTKSLVASGGITSDSITTNAISSTSVSSDAIEATSSVKAPDIEATSIKYTSCSFNKDNFIDIDTPSSNTEYNLIELPSFVGTYTVILHNASNKIIFSAMFDSSNSNGMASPSISFTYSTEDLTSFANVEYADSKIYIKTYSGGKLYYSYNTVEECTAPETYSSINLPSITTVYYSVDITKLSNTVFFGKGITIKGTVEADIIDNPTTGSYENLDVSKALSIGTTLGVSNGNGNYGQILDVNSDGNPQWSMPTGYTYVIKNKEQFVKWASDSHLSTFTNDYTSVLIDLDKPAAISDDDITGTGQGCINCSTTNTKLVYMASSSASLTFTDQTKFATTFHCPDSTDIKFVNLRIDSDAHAYCINGAGLVDRCYINIAPTTSVSYGLHNCSLVTDCDIISTATSSYSAYGIDACKAVVNTSAIARGANGYGFSYCSNIANCIDRGSTTYGFIGCTNTLNVTGTETQCTTTIGKANNLASLYGNITNPNVKGTMPIGANYASYDGVDPTTLFGGYWKIIQAI